MRPFGPSWSHGETDDSYVVQRLNEGPQNDYERMNWERISSSYQISLQNFSDHYNATTPTVTTEQVQKFIDIGLDVISVGSAITAYYTTGGAANFAFSISASSDALSFLRSDNDFSKLLPSATGLLPQKAAQKLSIGLSTINLIRSLNE